MILIFPVTFKSTDIEIKVKKLILNNNIIKTKVKAAFLLSLYLLTNTLLHTHTQMYMPTYINNLKKKGMLCCIRPIVIHSVNLGHTNSKHITHTHTLTKKIHTRANATDFTCVWYLAWYPRHTHTRMKLSFFSKWLTTILL